MEYSEALKKVSQKTNKENYLLLTLGYDNKILLPHKDGIALMAALANAEQFNDPYNKTHSITELDKDKIKIGTFSHEEYLRYKIAALLNMTIDEVKELGLQAT